MFCDTRQITPISGAGLPHVQRLSSGQSLHKVRVFGWHGLLGRLELAVIRPLTLKKIYMFLLIIVSLARGGL